MAIPRPFVILVAAALAGAAFGPLDLQAAEPVAVAALVAVLYVGGADIGARRMRAAAGPVLGLGVLGTFLTAGLIAVAAHAVLGLDWTLSGVLGAALAPTDPAVVFSVLGDRELSGRTRTVIEGEAGFNDPAGIALTAGMIELATRSGATLWVVAGTFALQMAIGALAGAVGGRVVVAGARAHPLLGLALAGGLYGVTAIVGGSGFLAVFLAGLLVGDAPAARLHRGVDRLGEAVVLVALGLTIDVVSLPGTTWRDGLVLAALITLVARPLTVAATLAPTGLTPRERAFVAWGGLKGAVPILLAAFAVLGGVAGADELYGIVFVTVAVSVLAQGALLPAVARRLGVAAER